MVSHNKFDTDNYLMFFLKSGETHTGLLKRAYDNIHPYWYIKLEGDETLVAIPDHAIDTVIRPSQSFIESFGKFIKEAQEKTNTPDINPLHDESINV